MSSEPLPAMPAPAAPLGLAPPTRGRPDISLRKWFAAYLAWMIGLAILLKHGQARAELGDGTGFVLMVLAGYAFYLSLCCTLFPAPTTGVVMLVASNELGLIASPALRVAVVALLGAFSTSMANLNEYHVFTFFLQYGRIARIRQTRAYRWAANGFAVSPFTIVSLASFVPIPVDVVRWMAILYRYSRLRFFGAYALGRSLRYLIWGLSAVWLDLSFRQILAFQVALVALAAAKIALSALRRRRSARGDASPNRTNTAVPAESELPSRPASNLQAEGLKQP